MGLRRLRMLRIICVPFHARMHVRAQEGYLSIRNIRNPPANVQRLEWLGRSTWRAAIRAGGGLQLWAFAGDRRGEPRAIFAENEVFQ